MMHSNVKPENRFVRQLKIIVIWAYNIVYNLLPFFLLKTILLRLTDISIGSQSVIHSPVRFLGMGSICIGSNSVIGSRCYLDNRVGISIGNNVSIAHDTKIYTLGHDVDDPYFAVKRGRVEIADYVCIFSNVLIMPGVKLGKGSVVFPGSVVTKDVEDYAIVGGNPARFIRYRSNDLRYKIEYDYWLAF
jgi:acetyltransferase-like isoleucine patch superfamily enzyme